MPDEEPVVSSTMAELDELLLGGPRTLTDEELAVRSGLPLDRVSAFWRSLGLPTTEPGTRQYTEADVEALARIADLVEVDGISWRTAGSLTRATGHSADRLALWHVEALVEDVASRFELDDISARLVVLDRLAELAPVLEAQLVHAWRRQLAAVAGRIGAEFAEAHAPDRIDRYALPLARAVGFADMVEFTRLTSGMDYTELADFVALFESGARDIVVAAGGRVVKTIGDAVLFVADDVVTGARIATGLAVGAPDFEPEPVQVRVGFVWGRVLARFGDVFGPPVNLAARLAEAAQPGSVLTDLETAALLADDGGWSLVPQPARRFAGVGHVEPVRVGRPEAPAVMPTRSPGR